MTLTSEERGELEALISKGKADARMRAHPRGRLQADEAGGTPIPTDREIASAFNLSTRPVARVRHRVVAEGLESALRPKPTKRI